MMHRLLRSAGPAKPAAAVATALAVAAAAAVALVTTAPPAGAHPFGPPPTALVTAQDRTVVVEWRSAADDAMAVGAQIGLATEEMVEAYLESATQAAPPSHVEEEISESAQLRDYLTERIVVRQDGERCEATVHPIDNFVWDGATVAHECAEPIAAIEVEISMLHDRHSAFRTFALAAESADPPHAVFTKHKPTTEWDLSAAVGKGVDGEELDGRLAGIADGGSGVRLATIWPLAALLGAVGAGSAAVAWRNRRRQGAA